METILPPSTCGYRRGIDWILDLLTTYKLTTRDYNLKVTSLHAKSFPACSAFTSSCLVTAPNNGYSSGSGFISSLNGGYLPTQISFLQTPVRNWLGCQVFFLITPRHGPSIKHCFQGYLCCYALIRCCGKLFTEPLPGNSSGIFAYLAIVA
jgi:hypothetical protein